MATELPEAAYVAACIERELEAVPDAVAQWQGDEPAGEANATSLWSLAASLVVDGLVPAVADFAGQVLANATSAGTNDTTMEWEWEEGNDTTAFFPTTPGDPSLKSTTAPAACEHTWVPLMLGLSFLPTAVTLFFCCCHRFRSKCPYYFVMYLHVCI